MILLDNFSIEQQMIKLILIWIGGFLIGLAAGIYIERQGKKEEENE